MVRETRISEFLIEDTEKDMPLYTIGTVAELIGTTNQTIRLYEKHGLLKPARRNKNRFYSKNDVRWLLCLRVLIHQKKFGIGGVKKLLGYAACWEIMTCPDKLRNKCHAYIHKIKPYCHMNYIINEHEPRENCGSVFVLLPPKQHGRKK
jgi:MerR family transcriptional regulator/heat shock protein HspR